MGRAHGESGSDYLITHSICENCKDNMTFQLGVDLAVFIDSLKQPIVVIDREGTVVTGNDQAKTFLRKALPDMKGYKGGEVFECAYARLPEGCGHTIHCSGCTIRRTVMKTHGTGKSFLKVPASLKRKAPEAPETINLLISTERINDMVLLRIDQVNV